jgi:hypothetical protein
MILPSILVGIFAIIMGAYTWHLAEKTAKGKLVPRSLGVWWSRERTYSIAVLLWFIGKMFIVVGLIR